VFAFYSAKILSFISNYKYFEKLSTIFNEIFNY
jgi:hypothetical protein